jgi:hypothetical protein
MPTQPIPKTKPKQLIIVLIIAIAVILLGAATFLVIRFVLGGDEDTWICEENGWVAHGNPDAEKPATGCKGVDTTQENIDNTVTLTEDVVYQEELASMPEWIRSGPNADTGPWNEDVYIAYSEDGLTFTGDKLFVPHAGVANLLLTSNGTLIAIMQYFSFTNEAYFDKIAYTISDDDGLTWSPLTAIKFEGLRDPAKGSPNAVDPTLVQLEDGTFRLYFTFQNPGDGFPQLYSATADTIDGIFVVEGKQLTTDEIVLDPTVIYYNGIWHHYTTTQTPPQNGIFTNVHSTSTTGLDFTRQADITLPMSMLGGILEDNGVLRFYGCWNGIKSATSNDGFAWTMDTGTRVAQGADPGIAKLPDGSYLMIYTHMGDN